MSKNNVLLELDGQRYLIEGEQWRQVSYGVDLATLAPASGSLRVLSDFGVSPESRFVQGDSRYAEQLLQRDLRESGEALGNRRVLLHRCSKQDRYNSALFFSVVNNADYSALLGQVEALQDRALPFSYYEAYVRAIARHAGKGADAFVFIHGNVVDVAVTSQGRMESFSSQSGVSGGERDTGFINALVDQVMTQERVAKVKLENLYLFELLATGQDGRWKESLSQRLGLQLAPVREQRLMVDGAVRSSSMLPLFRDLSIGDSLLDGKGRFQRQATRWLPAVAALLLALNSVLAWMYVEHDRDIALQQDQLASQQKALREQPPVQAVQAIEYGRYLEGFENLIKSSGHKTYQQFLNELMAASDVGNPVVYDWVSVDYPETLSPQARLQIDLVGHIGKGWHNPLNAFDKLTAAFTQAGYVLKDTAIGTTDDGLGFVLVMEAPAL